jgi:CubicO group peptidase (beta-lactamase class C family)
MWSRFLPASGLILIHCLAPLFALAQQPDAVFVRETWPWRPPDGAIYPGREWQKLKSPADAGFSTAKLEGLRGWLKTQNTTGLMVVVGGYVLFEYGDVAHVTKTASVRKSILGMLMGNYVADGKIKLHRTVKELGLEDMWPFLPVEENARLEDLLQSKSGIYLDADPWAKRGQNLPGTVMHYNNWDFNAAGTAFEKATGRDIYDAFETDLARPLEMQDFDRQKQKKNQTMPEEKISVHPEYAMYLSTRDMARLGLLMLRDGNWKDKQRMPRNWASYLTTLYTPSSQVGPKWLRTELASGPMRWGYGALWWVWDEPRGSNPSDWTALTGAFSAMGTDGQFITVLPALDMVVAHMNYTIMEPPEKAVSEFEYQTILQMIIDAHCGEPGCK